MSNRPGLNATGPLEVRLRLRLKDATRVHIAVAYAKRSGVERLLRAGLVPERTKAIIGLGFAQTDPDAVELLVDGGSDVRLFLGPDPPPERFHPKLYLVEADTRLTVFSGSANLTAGGLADNVEQFEELTLRDAGRSAQMRRFARIWACGEPFDDVEASREWLR
jgi:HKD family nuclease